MRAKSGMSIANVDFNGSSDAAADQASGHRAARRSHLSDIALGLGLAAVVPALFWTAAIWATCSVFGFAMSGATLATIGLAVATFLTIVCSAMFRAD